METQEYHGWNSRKIVPTTEASKTRLQKKFTKYKLYGIKIFPKDCRTPVL